MKFGIRYKIFAVIMALSLMLGGLFVVSSLVKLRTSTKKMDVFRQHEAVVIGRFLDTFFDRPGDFSCDSYVQQLIDQIKIADENVKRISIHAKAPEGESPSGYWFLASTKREKIGLPSDPEDLEAMQGGQDVYLVEASSEEQKEGEHTLDLTSPIRDLDNNIIGVAGITVLYHHVYSGETLEQEFEHTKSMAKAIANSLDAAVTSEKILSSKNQAQIKIEEIVQGAPYISRLSIHARAPEGKSSSGYWFLASTALERIGQPSDPEDVESIREDSRKILFEEDDAGNRFIDVTYPLHDVDGRALATAGITIDLGAEDAFLAIAHEEDFKEMILFLLGILGAGGIFSLLFSAYFSRLITGPINEYVEAAKDIAQGNLARKVVVDSQDEIGEFAEVFNSMAMSLKKTHENLEERVEERARELFVSEERFKALFDAAGDCIFILEVQKDREPVIVDVNQVACELYGYNKEEMVGMSTSEISDPAEYEEVQKRARNLLAEGKVSFIANHRKKDGSTFPIDVLARLVKIDGKSFVLAIGRDITEKRMLEEQVRHSQKMKALGTLTGGIAHEFNNIMNGVMGFSELLQQRLEKGSVVRKYADRIMDSADRAAKLTAGLLAYSRRGAVRMETMEVNEAVEAVCELIANMVGEKIELVVSKSDEALSVKADKAQLEQILVNLSSNAVWAMPEGGVLTIKTGITTFDKLYRKGRLKIAPGKYAHIFIGDTGTGMSREVQEKIFEPFFTTKDVGEGTGLGLAMVYGSIRRHDGHISVKSQPGAGTAFDIYLPLVDATGEKEQEEISAPVDCGDETVLVAEDNETVRDLVEEFLGEAGFKVLTAVDGEEAIEVFRDNRDDIKLLLFDIGMPNKSGKEAFDEIKKMAPEIKVIFISGYGDENAHLAAASEEGYTTVQKPVKPTSLLKTIRDELDKSV